MVNAVRCAVEVQTAMADRTAGIAEDRRIAFRIGINIGDIIVEGDDIFGDGVNVAARLQEIAPPGGICISSRVHDDVRDRLDTAFEDGGTQTLKNIARPVQVWRWQPGTAVAPKPASPPTALPLPDKPSIAVLPFENMSGDPEQAYFADGLVEDIITGLSRFKSLFVIARNSSFTYKGRAVDVARSAASLASATCWKAACAVPAIGYGSLASSSRRQAARTYGPTASKVTSKTSSRCRTKSREGLLVGSRRALNWQIERAKRKVGQSSGIRLLSPQPVGSVPLFPEANEEALSYAEKAVALDPEFPLLDTWR